MARAQTNIAGLDAVVAESFTAKGQVVAATGAGAFSAVAPGSDGQVLGYDSTAPAGVAPVTISALTAGRAAAADLFLYQNLGG